MNTIFYDKAKKRIVRRAENKVDTGEKKGFMVTKKTIVHGTDKYPRLMAREGVALALSTEDNVDKIMTYLEQSQKKIAKMKETLKMKEMKVKV